MTELPVRKFCRIKSGWLPVTLLLLFSTSCSNNKKQFDQAIEDRSSMSVMTTRGMQSLISDSGVIKYRISAELWEIFDEKNPSYWAFEEGAMLEQFDYDMNVVATITADTAYYFDKQEKWELRGNVHSRNVDDEEFETDILYWDQRHDKVWSDVRIKIKQKKQFIIGKGFDSNQNFTTYTIRQPEGMFPIKE